ncbi:hypothetical protein, partial [Salmonella enterica]|uniref:hypothetical protein n=1 Tax=Salmonella enterica TaxID=28901 RepID=UPI003296C671
HERLAAATARPGQAHARQVAESLAEFARSVALCAPAVGKDITDHLSAGKTLDEVVVTWEREPSASIDLAPDLHQFLAVRDPDQTWV